MARHTAARLCPRRPGHGPAQHGQRHRDHPSAWGARRETPTEMGARAGRAHPGGAEGGRSLHPCELQQTCARATGENPPSIYGGSRSPICCQEPSTSVAEQDGAAALPLLTGSPGRCPGSSRTGRGCGPAAFPVAYSGVPSLYPQEVNCGRLATSLCFLLPPLITQHPLKTDIPQVRRARGVCCCPLQSPTSPSLPGKRYSVPSKGLGKGRRSPGSSLHCLCSTQSPGLICTAPSYVKINLGAMLCFSSPPLSPPEPAAAPAHQAVPEVGWETDGAGKRYALPRDTLSA